MRRDLTVDDLIRMHIPKRYWNASFKKVSNEIMNSVIWYGKNLDKMVRRGVGLLLFSDNGSGKTSLAVCFGKELRRRCKSVLFFEAADLKRAVFEKEYFDDEQTIWERARSVDVLILDDLGKGIADDKDYGINLIDELIRTRNGKMKSTFITTNMNQEDLKKFLKPSTMKTIIECIIPIFCDGPDRRKEKFLEIKEYIDG